MNIVFRVIRRARRSIMSIVLRNFTQIKKDGSGMLSSEVYFNAYREARKVKELDILEIGAARGAGSVSLALGIKESKSSSKLISVEKFDGGSNIEFGNKNANLENIRKLFNQYGVSDIIEVFPEYLEYSNFEKLKSKITTSEIGLLMIDADGRLDIFLPMLWDMIPEGTTIILDDYKENYKFRVKSDRYPQGRTKELTCYRLLNELIRMNKLFKTKLIDATMFTTKTGGAFSQTELQRLAEIVEGVRAEYGEWLAKSHLS